MYQNNWQAGTSRYLPDIISRSCLCDKKAQASVHILIRQPAGTVNTCNKNVLQQVGVGYESLHRPKMPVQQIQRLLLWPALPGGNRNNNDGSFNNAGNNGIWWSSTQNNSSNAYNRNLWYNNPNLNRGNNNKSNGFSVRCIRD